MQIFRFVVPSIPVFVVKLKTQRVGVLAPTDFARFFLFNHSGTSRIVNCAWTIGLLKTTLPLGGVVVFFYSAERSIVFALFKISAAVEHISNLLFSRHFLPRRSGELMIVGADNTCTCRCRDAEYRALAGVTDVHNTVFPNAVVFT